MSGNLLKGNLDLILLSILEPTPKYGLEIINEAQRRTNGYFNFKEGSLYPALHRLQKAGLVTSEFSPSDRGGPRRRYYRLTDVGRNALDAKREEWARFKTALETLWQRS